MTPVMTKADRQYITYWADTSRAKAELGFAPKYPAVEEGIGACV